MSRVKKSPAQSLNEKKYENEVYKRVMSLLHLFWIGDKEVDGFTIKDKQIFINSLEDAIRSLRQELQGGE